MSNLTRLWTKIARFAAALEGIDDPAGHHMFSLEKRIDKLERDIAHHERHLGSRAGGGVLQ
jgi:hypothetical protein